MKFCYTYFSKIINLVIDPIRIILLLCNLSYQKHTYFYLNVIHYNSVMHISYLVDIIYYKIVCILNYNIINMIFDTVNNRRRADRLPEHTSKLNFCILTFLDTVKVLKSLYFLK